MPLGINRRSFLKTAGATVVGAYAAQTLPNASAANEKSLVAVSLPLSTFPYADVQLLDSPMKRQFDENHARFQNLDDDRLLKEFRQVAGFPVPGEGTGGLVGRARFSLE